MIFTPTDHATATAEGHQRLYEGKQYEGLLAWEVERDDLGNYVPVRSRAPRLRSHMAKIICDTIQGMILSAEKFPTLSVANENLQMTVDWIRDHKLKQALPDAILKGNIQGSCAITFGFVRGHLVMRTYDRVSAWPIFDDARELAGLIVRYAASHPETGQPGWFRGTIDSLMERWEWSRSATGPWDFHSGLEHGYGFVPAIWNRHLVAENDNPDGISLLTNLHDDIIELDYAVSRPQRSLNWTMDPMTVINDENPEKAMKNIARSPAGSLFLGPQGKASFLEIAGDGIRLQMEFATTIRKVIQEISRVTIIDPEKLVSGQLSGYALELAFGSMIDLAGQIRSGTGHSLSELICKILAASRIETARRRAINLPGIQGLAENPDGVDWAARALTELTSGFAGKAATQLRYHPWLGKARAWPIPFSVSGAWNIDLAWGRIIKMSPAETVQMAQAVTAAKAGEIISSRTATRLLAALLGVERISAEVDAAEIEYGRDLPQE